MLKFSEGRASPVPLYSGIFTVWSPVLVISSCREETPDNLREKEMFCVTVSVSHCGRLGGGECVVVAFHMVGRLAAESSRPASKVDITITSKVPSKVPSLTHFCQLEFIS